MDSRDYSHDTLDLYLNSGIYEVNIEGIRKGERERVFSSRRESFPSTLAKLIDYHNECYSLMLKEKKIDGTRYVGAGSDRGNWEYPWMVCWTLSLHCPLPKEDEGLLRGIVNMHNHAAVMALGYYESKDKLKENNIEA